MDQRKQQIIDTLIEARKYEIECIEKDHTFLERGVRGQYRHYALPNKGVDTREYAFAYLFDIGRRDAQQLYGINPYGMSVVDLIDALRNAPDQVEPES